MSSIGVRTSQETAIYSENVLTKYWTFNDDLTWNVVSGGANGVSENSNSGAVYAGNKSILTTFTDTGVLIIDAGGTDGDVTINKTGNYILSYRLTKDDVDATIDVGVYMYVNGILQTYNKFEQTLFTDNDGYIDEIWNCYFQYCSLEEDDVVTFQFDFQCDTVGTKLYFDGLKLELVDRELGLPSYYLEPLPIIIENSQTIDVGSIGSNASVIVSATVTGAKLGDYVQMIYPVDLVSEDLTVGYPIVTATDTVGFVIHNKTGGSINPDSGTFTFKIVR